MVIGIDVYHSGTGRSSKGSVSAFVASLNKDLTSWHSKACLQRPGQEIIDLLKSCFISALTVYHQVCINSQIKENAIFHVTVWNKIT